MDALSESLLKNSTEFPLKDCFDFNIDLIERFVLSKFWNNQLISVSLHNTKHVTFFSLKKVKITEFE